MGDSALPSPRTFFFSFIPFSLFVRAAFLPNKTKKNKHFIYSSFVFYEIKTKKKDKKKLTKTASLEKNKWRKKKGKNKKKESGSCVRTARKTPEERYFSKRATFTATPAWKPDSLGGR